MAPPPAATRSPRTTARVAGVFSYLYVPSAFLVRGDALATAQRIAARPVTFNLGIVADVTGQVFLLLAALGLYDLFRDVDRRAGRLMVAFVGVVVAVETANAFNLIAASVLLSGSPEMGLVPQPQLASLAAMFLTTRITALVLSQAFWGLWLFPLGTLVVKSGTFP